MRITFALMLALAGTANAAPIAQLAVDVDGDGSIDHIELDPTGVLRIDSKAAPGSVTLAPSITRASLSAAHIRGVPTIVATIRSSAGDEAIVLERDPRLVWHLTTRVQVGGVGLDHDYSVEVEATPEGVFRFQTRPGIRRCDGKSAYLFAEGLDGTRFRRLSKIPTKIAANATAIPAHADTTPTITPLLYQARVASVEIGAGDAGGLGIPQELDDGNPTTQWREELASDGEGQFFTFESRAPTAKAAEIRIVAGGKSFNRPRRIGVVAAHAAWHVDLPDGANDPVGTAYVADLPTPIEGCVTIVLETTYGPASGQTAIAELEVFAEGERAGGGEAALAHVVAEGKDGAQNAGAVLARRGAAGAAAIDAELAKTSDPDARTRLVRALVQLRDPAAGPILARVATQDWLRERDLLDVIGTLGVLGDVQQLHDLAMKPELQLATRVAAVHAMGAASPTQRAALVDLAGAGPRELRHAVIDVLSGVAVATLAQTAAAQTSASSSGDLWRATTRRARAVAGERADALAAMTAALPSATDYERRYRLLDGIAALGDAAALQVVASLLAGLPTTAETAAFKQVAARAIAESPRPEALELIVKLARDGDPGVRLAALGAIAMAEAGTPGAWHAAEGPDAIDRVIMTMLSTDTWPELRRRAAQTLGGRCERIGPARALGDAVAKDSELSVRGDALGALVQCRAAGISELLAKTWDDSNAPIDLRQRAVDLTVALADRALATKLLGKFKAWRGASITSAEALALVQNAAYAIGRLAPAGAADALIDALEDAAFPEIVGAAATSLGLLGPACPTAAKLKLKVLSASEENQIAVAAKRAYAQCGK